ncbi:MAG TPA: hypothetical protein VEK86_06435 [Gemmatimonadales bacterium]|nr:hypothetical protein [Gemmatimonadales bacterium]
MTLARLVLAWLPVALEFTIVGGLGVRSSDVETGAPRDDAQAIGPGRMVTKGDLAWRSAEAAVVTLCASLWFDAVGHGGWWLLFLLLGLMVALAGLPGSAATGPGTTRRLWEGREILVRTIREAVRYVLAGAILAWRLG